MCFFLGEVNRTGNTRAVGLVGGKKCPPATQAVWSGAPRSQVPNVVQAKAVLGKPRGKDGNGEGMLRL